MSTLLRQVYVISDLHLGGRPAAAGDPASRGFRMCTRGDALAGFIRSLAERPSGTTRTELVINGDFVDFLAETDKSGAFVPFTRPAQEAAAKLEAIAAR